ncbi:MAG: ASCH domain-containing protein [Patescibacteria group bacterium]|nr:ASCH domain-containing protein [Patescibacteria group bacterium]
MPLIAVNMTAFEALLIDIPYQLAQYGHKLYLHINPSVKEVISLQRLGWNLNAAMPSAYRPNIITQQWSIDLNQKTMRTMRVKKRFFDFVVSGKKTLEVRVGYDTINRIQVGERIRLITHTENCIIQVRAIRHYDDFETALQCERYNYIVPDALSLEEVMLLLKNIYPPRKEKLGVVVLDFALIAR